MELSEAFFINAAFFPAVEVSLSVSSSDAGVPVSVGSLLFSFGLCEASQRMWTCSISPTTASEVPSTRFGASEQAGAWTKVSDVAGSAEGDGICGDSWFSA